MELQNPFTSAELVPQHRLGSVQRNRPEHLGLLEDRIHTYSEHEDDFGGRQV
jgi:hypothetical protein